MTFALRRPKAIHLRPGEHEEILGRLEVGWELVCSAEAQKRQSLKRVKIEEQLLWHAWGLIGSRQEHSFKRYLLPRTDSIPIPKIGGSQPPTPHPELQSLLSQEGV